MKSESNIDSVNSLDNNEIILALNKIINRLELLENRLDKIEKSTNHMDQHIWFVEEIYESIKMPFHNLIGYFNPTNENPQIEQSKEQRMIDHQY